MKAQERFIKQREDVGKNEPPQNTDREPYHATRYPIGSYDDVTMTITPRFGYVWPFFAIALWILEGWLVFKDQSINLIVEGEWHGIGAELTCYGLNPSLHLYRWKNNESQEHVRSHTRGPCDDKFVADPYDPESGDQFHYQVTVYGEGIEGFNILDLGGLFGLSVFVLLALLPT